MSSPADLSPERGLALVGALQGDIADLSRQEEKLRKEMADRRHAIQRKHREHTGKSAAHFDEQIVAGRAAAEAEAEGRRTRHAQRRERIDRGYQAALKGVQAQARKRKEKYLSELQLRHFRAEKQKPAEERALEKEYAEFNRQLGALAALLQKLKAKARRSLAGYGAFRRQLRGTVEIVAEGRGRDELRQATEDDLEQLKSALRDFAAPPIALLFAYFHPALLGAGLALAALLAIFVAKLEPLLAVAPAAGLFLLVLGLYALGFRQAKEAAARVAEALRRARAHYELCRGEGSARFQREQQTVQEKFSREFAEIEGLWPRGEELGKQEAATRREKLEKQIGRVLARHERPSAGPNGEGAAAAWQSLEAAAETRRQELAAWQQGELGKIAEEETRRWASVCEAWQRDVIPAYQELRSAAEFAAQESPPWSAITAEGWLPATTFPSRLHFGREEWPLNSLPQSPELALPGPPQVGVPLALDFGAHGSLIVESDSSSDALVMGCFNHILLRLFALLPPGKLAVTIVDPVGLGQNFAGLMHLGDYEESLINRRIWTQRDQIEERLGELNEHIEKVIQMYLRSEFASIAEYNARAGSVAEKYHFLVVADFPAGFSETAVKRLQSIAASGPRCGVFTLLQWDRRQTAPDGLVPDDLRKNCLCLEQTRTEVALRQPPAPAGGALRLEAPPEPGPSSALVHRIGQRSVDSNRVQVPFTQVAPRVEEYWRGETSQELRVAVGRTGATKLQYLAIGKGTRQHALFAGKTGSGKSTLFHVIITNLALTFSPDQVEFYLIDFKKGVEFKCYAAKRLPHARVVAIESDREFGLSVLQRVDEELKRRGDLFRQLGVQDIAGYVRAGGQDPMPRSLLMIDEFQEFFVEDDTIAQGASLLFDRIVRQGRAFGIHVLLGSQTLGGAYTLARATLGQMVIRVALQCNEADAYLIMDDSNPAPRLLSRPGEGIYNDAAGAVEGNSPFQVVWLPDDERDVWLDKVRELETRAGGRHLGPVVYEGNAPADIAENHLLAHALASPPSGSPPSAGRIWLGAPNAIKGPTEIAFQRQSAHNLLLIGQREETALTLFALSLLALSAQYPKEGAQFFFITAAAPGSAEAALLDSILATIPQPVRRAEGAQAGEAIGELARELKTRQASSESSSSFAPVFAFIHSLQRFKKLRQEEDFSFSSSSEEGGNPGAQLADLLSEGSTYGIHLLIGMDTFANVNRFLSRRTLGEFAFRILFQMSANDSASLMDSPRASQLGLYRALLYDEQQGSTETFRPYATPGRDWIESLPQSGDKRPT